MALGNIRQVVRSAGGASPEELFSTETENRKETPIIDQEAADQAAADQAAADQAAQDQGYSYSPPQQQQAQSATYTNEDFYPGPADPAQFAFREGLQVVARPGRMPMGAITKAAASIERKRQQTNQAKDEIADLINRRVNIKDASRQQAFNEYASGVFQNKVLSFAELGIQENKQAEADKLKKKVDKLGKIEAGDRLIDKVGLGGLFEQKKKKAKLEAAEEKWKGMTYTDGTVRPDALKAEQDAFFNDPNKVNKLYSEIAKDPRKRGVLLETMRQLEAYGRVMDKNYEEAKKYFEDYNTPSKEFVRDENLLDRAKRILNPDFYKTKDGEIVYEGKIEDLLSDNAAYNRAVTLNDYFQRQVLNAANTAGFATKSYDPVSKAGYWLVKDEKNWEEFKEVQAIELVNGAPEALQDYWETKTGEKISNDADLKKAAKDYLDGMLPAKYEQKMTVKPTSSGGGGGSDKAVYSYSRPAETQSVISTAWGTQGTNPLDPLKDDVYAYTLTTKVGNQFVESGSMPFEKINESGQKEMIDLIPIRVEMNRQNGDAFIIGYNPNDTTIKSVLAQDQEISDIKLDSGGNMVMTMRDKNGTITNRKITQRSVGFVPMNSVNAETINNTWPGFQSELQNAVASGSSGNLNTFPLAE